MTLEKRNKIVVFLLCFFAYTTAYLCRANFAIALPRMQQEATLNKIILGSIGGAFFWTYAIGQLINGFLGDLISPRLLVGIGLFVSALCNILIFLFPNTTILIISWVINGFALAALWGPIMRLVSVLYSPKIQSKIALALNTSMVLGYFLAWGGLGRVIATNSWRLAFLIPGLVGLLIAFLWVILLPRGVVPKLEREVTPKKIQGKLKFGPVVLILIILCAITQGIIKDGISLWGPTILIEYAGLSHEKATRSALLIPLLSLLGMFLAGFSEKLTASDDSLSFALLIVLSGLSFGAVRFANLEGLKVAILISLAGAFAYGANTVLLAFVPLRFAKTGRVSAIAGVLDFLSYMGSAIAGPLMGFLAESGSWQNALFIWLILALTGAIASIGLRKTLKSKETADVQVEFRD